MAKPIVLTNELIDRTIQDFKKMLSYMRMARGSISYTKSFTYDEPEKAKLVFTPTAYAKMLALVMNYDTEVAWHGVGDKIGKRTYQITDILVYPQTVSGGTVEMDPVGYSKWLVDNGKDDRFDHIVMQGHSHVNFPTNPSSVDLEHQERILSQLKGDMFYIFIICNKKLENTITIYDLSENIVYENSDVALEIQGVDFDAKTFLTETHGVVKFAGINQAEAIAEAYKKYQGGRNERRNRT